jgi:CBS domain-containing protein
MRCSEIMKANVECLRSGDHVRDAARVMRESNVGFIPICDESKNVLGTVTDRDIAIRVVAEGLPATTPISDVMSNEVVACRGADEIEQATELMRRHRKSRIMCLDDQDHLVGVISLSDLAKRADASSTLKGVASREARP